MIRNLLFLSLLLSAHPVAGFTLPERGEGNILDFAGVLSPEREAHLNKQIDSLKQNSGYQLTIVSIDSLRSLGWQGNLQNLAGRMRREWMPIDATAPTTILVLLSKSDKSAAVATGSAYPKMFVNEPTHDFLNVALNSLRRGNFDRGAQRGVNEIVDLFEPKDSGYLAGWFGLGIGLLILMLPFGLIGYQKLDWFLIRFKTCPYCTRKSLRLDKQTQTYMPGKPGMQKVKSRVYCKWCGYRKDDALLSEGPDLMKEARKIPTEMVDR